MNRITLIVAGAIVASTSLARAQTVDTMADCKQFAAAWEAAYNKGEAATLAAMYAPDATYSGVFWTATSRPAIAQGFKAETASGAKFSSIDCAHSHRAGNINYAEGTWDATGKGPDGKEMPMKGHWLAVASFHGGRYTLLEHAANMQMPAPAK